MRTFRVIVSLPAVLKFLHMSAHHDATLPELGVVVKLSYQALHILQHKVLLLADLVGRHAPLALAHAHRAARGVESQPNLPALSLQLSAVAALKAVMTPSGPPPSPNLPAQPLHLSAAAALIVVTVLPLAVLLASCKGNRQPSCCLQQGNTGSGPCLHSMCLPAYFGNNLRSAWLLMISCEDWTRPACWSCTCTPPGRGNGVFQLNIVGVHVEVV